MGVRRFATVGVCGLALVAASLLATTGVAAARSSATTAKASSCPTTGGKDDPWPAFVQGRPAGINPHTTAAIYMWHDGSGWSIRVTHKTTNVRSFGGQLFTSGTFTNVHPVHLEKNDVFQVSSDKHTIVFLFKNYGGIDGLNFFTHCAPSITFSYQSDGATSPASKIIIGKNSVRPPTDPFQIFRTAKAPTAA
jgi:hypothetical protein